MKLSPALISQGYQILSPTGDRTLSLRDSRISVVANLGATNDDYDSLDLSNNDIIKLENFPLLPRLKTLIVAGNRVSKIADDIGSCLPNLSSLVLTNNSITTISQLEPLFKCKIAHMFKAYLGKSLERLALLDNHVVAVPHFREYLIHKIPSLKYLNFTKVKRKEREDATALFCSDKATKLFKEMGYDPKDVSHTLNGTQTHFPDSNHKESGKMELDE
ncbi:leucine-rich repeat, typical subtype containing protein [Theileria orientalis strain Shintoku]|uniref:Leucine-rich repeat, typical subtype containing protein n=1 Tax=Theileria orientalis strain Shintoku TaxID=869250 RepID=J4CC79_THEOR|nr:leucine-rich repeat, typical subtype containing protein [Theileria orientalis strain Shintoku]BAM38922.1 leucine-rich repeat, typical subtype containing protein [Theileria orientalis strain Shintoku]|eukprot:XP_009689223.1 leucine-rich repeat, typical subtype containing protein [Theileria orientalis strain Shintoku]